MRINYRDTPSKVTLVTCGYHWLNNYISIKVLICMCVCIICFYLLGLCVCLIIFILYTFFLIKQNKLN